MTDPRITVLAAISRPKWHPVPETYGMPWKEAEALLAEYDASRAAAPSAPAGPTPAEMAFLTAHTTPATGTTGTPGGLARAQANAETRETPSGPQAGTQRIRLDDLTDADLDQLYNERDQLRTELHHAASGTPHTEPTVQIHIQPDPPHIADAIRDIRRHGIPPHSPDAGGRR